MSKEYDGCDGVLWHLEQKEDQYEIDATLYRYTDRTTEPSDLGYKYYILTFKVQDPNSPEFLSAYIGDVAYFVKNHASAGYHGVMVKDKSVPKKTIKQIFNAVLTNFDFPSNIIRSVVRQV
jgi:hypothetical protein